MASLSSAWKVAGKWSRFSYQLETQLQCSGISTHRLFPTLVQERRRTVQVSAAWTRRGKAERTKQPRGVKRSWSQVHDKYLKPFCLDVFISSNYVTAKIMHRVTSRVMAVASSSSKDFADEMSRIDLNACERVGELLGERARGVDVFAVTMMKNDQKMDTKTAAVVGAFLRSGIILT